MKRLLLCSFALVMALGVSAQQDRIFTKDGREIACRITNTSNAERIFYEEYPSDDEVLHRTMLISEVDYIIRVGKHMAYDDWGTLKEIKEKSIAPMPVHKFIYGIGGGVTTGNFRNKQAIGEAELRNTKRGMAWFVTGSMHYALLPRLYLGGEVRYDNITPYVNVKQHNLMLGPSIEQRFYLRNSRSFFFVGGSLAYSFGWRHFERNISGSTWEIYDKAAWPQHTVSFNPKFGVDMRVANKLYLNLALVGVFDFLRMGKIDATPINQGSYNPYGYKHVDPILNVGVQVGLRFGSNEK
ncbi:MAG: hypothetical protein IKT94_00845 [Rikenellaceae bacterium]|nr:hypothetical protein [Rikenellaceae bacterium]